MLCTLSPPWTLHVRCSCLSPSRPHPSSSHRPAHVARAWIGPRNAEKGQGQGRSSVSWCLRVCHPSHSPLPNILAAWRVINHQGKYVAKGTNGLECCHQHSLVVCAEPHYLMFLGLNSLLVKLQPMLLTSALTFWIMSTCHLM